MLNLRSDVLFVLAALSVLSPGSAAAAGAGPLEATCPVDWRAVPLIEAVRDLAHRLDVP